MRAALEAFTQSDGSARALATMSFAYLFAALALDSLDPCVTTLRPWP